MQCLYVCAAQLLSPFRCPVRDSQSTYIPRVRRKGRLEGFCEGLYTMQNAGQHQKGHTSLYQDQCATRLRRRGADTREHISSGCGRAGACAAAGEGLCARQRRRDGRWGCRIPYAVSPGRRKRYRILSRDAMGHETGMEAIGTGHLVQQVVWWRGRGDHHRAIGPRDQYSHGLKDGSSTGRSTRSTRLASGASRRSSRGDGSSPRLLTRLDVVSNGTTNASIKWVGLRPTGRRHGRSRTGMRRLATRWHG